MRERPRLFSLENLARAVATFPAHDGDHEDRAAAAQRRCVSARPTPASAVRTARRHDAVRRLRDEEAGPARRERPAETLRRIPLVEQSSLDRVWNNASIRDGPRRPGDHRDVRQIDRLRAANRMRAHQIPGSRRCRTRRWYSVYPRRSRARMRSSSTSRHSRNGATAPSATKPQYDPSASGVPNM